MLDRKKPDPRGVTVMIRIFTLIVTSALILGCEDGPIADKGPTTGDCADPPITPINIIFVKNNEIRVSNGNVPTRLGNVLQFKLTGDPDTMVTISGKKSDSGVNKWIEGSGAGKSIYVCVPPGLFDEEDPKLLEKTYAYDIDVAGVGKLDPLVTVRR